jgi:hypothetical protein
MLSLIAVKLVQEEGFVHLLQSYLIHSVRKPFIIFISLVLFKGYILCWIFIVLAHWNNSPLVDMSPNWNTLTWFRANPSLLLLLNTACFLEKHRVIFHERKDTTISITRRHWRTTSKVRKRTSRNTKKWK